MEAIEPKTLERDGMRIDIDVPIEMDDGLVLRADVFRPLAEGTYRRGPASRSPSAGWVLDASR